MKRTQVALQEVECVNYKYVCYEKEFLTKKIAHWTENTGEVVKQDS